MVPNVTVDDNIRINGNIVTRLKLSWGEPFNNLNPIVNYTVSCSSDGRCPPNFTTSGNYNAIIITNLTTMTTYTFSVVATNSIGSGEAGVVMITTPPGNVIYSIITSSEGMKLRYMCLAILVLHGGVSHVYMYYMVGILSQKVCVSSLVINSLVLLSKSVYF